MSAAREPQEMKVPEGLHEGALVAGKYRVGRPIGAGGMGLVLAAVHEALGTAIALKVIHRESLRDPSLPARFVQEGRAAAHLKSEHVVRVHDLGTLEDGTPYLAMEQLEGVDLGALLEEKPRLSYEEAVEIVRQTCDALAEAHALGIVHRDLKPQNLFLVQRPGKSIHVKVLDFGIAKFLSQDHFQLQIATHSAAIMGSPIYMAPEQMRAAKAADGRSDLWSLGVIFYQLLVGKVPFEAESLPELCAMVLTEKAPTIDAAALGIPEGLAAIVSRLLKTDPAERFSTAEEIVEALVPYVTTKPVFVPEVGKLVGQRALSRETTGASPNSARITPQGDGRDIRPDGATMPALRGLGSDVKTVFDRPGGTKPGARAAGSEPMSADEAARAGGELPGMAGSHAGVEGAPSRAPRYGTTTTRRRMRRTIAEVLAEGDDTIVPAGVPQEGSGNGRTLFGLLLLALVAGGGLYVWKFHGALLAPFRDAAPSASAQPAPSTSPRGTKLDDVALPNKLHPAPSADPSHTTAPGTPGRTHERTGTDAGPDTPDAGAASMHDASIAPPAVEHPDAATGPVEPGP